ncbi:MAG: hypothetical protein C0598_12535 [Marinilabiliales bacterium]|nr:MAG: hypothetical protein C0598_12535 [Marinilabiliales bacterium]
MKKAIILILIVSWIVNSSFIGKEELAYPTKKINRELRRLWKDESVDIDKFNQNVYVIANSNDTLGYLYLGRVNSCRQGGCAVNSLEENLAFEFFDYFMITDSDLRVKKVKIYNYQATHGHEVMSSGWLRQFKMYDGKQSLVYGKDIEAISGATISAKALNEDLKYTLNHLEIILSNKKTSLSKF